MSRIVGDLIVTGTLKAGAFSPPDNSVGNTEFNGNDPLTAAKQQHQYQQVYSQKRGVVAATERWTAHVANDAGTLVNVVAGMTLANAGAATVSVDVLKNGVTILSAPIVLDSTNVAYVVEIGTVVPPGTYVLGDSFDVSVTATAGGGTLGQGLYVALTFQEAVG